MRRAHRLPLIALTLTLVAALVGLEPRPPAARAGLQDAADLWWDRAWPYRLPITASGTGVAQGAVDFTAVLNSLGLNHALLDLRSLRVVPYTDHAPGDPIPHAETYSTMLEDTDNPQIGWHASGVYWTVNDGSAEPDGTRYSQGTGSLKATVENWPSPVGYGYPGVELHIAVGEPATDWSPYESFLYDVWPQVNASALDQAPDLYWFKLYNACAGGPVTQGGPPLALDRWNGAAVSLNPLDNCWPADGLDLSDITRIEFHTRDNDTVNGRSGLWDDGDALTLWFDNLRLVDQDSGAVRWATVPGVTRYYLYFDMLTHQGHPPAVLDENLGSATVTGVVGGPEAGGYFHQVEGAAGLGDRQLWTAPTVEKILRGMATPVTRAPLRVAAARGEFEPFQLVLWSPSAGAVTVHVSDLTGPGGTIAAPTIHQVKYVNTTTAGDHFDRFGPWPDPLWPLDDGASVTLAANQNQPFWFTLQVPWDATPGVYNGTVTLGGATVPYQLEVWNFSLPREIHLRSEWGFGWSSIVEDVYQGYGDWDCYWETVEAFKQDFIDHRLIPKGPGWPAGIYWGWYDCDAGALETGTPDNPWYFTYQGTRYVLGQGFNDGYGFPAFLAFGPASNWPPDSRPSSFCGLSRGADPPGNSAYNARWGDYLAALDAYLTDPAHDFSAAAYAHIVNEPQTYADYDVVAYLARLYKAAAPHLKLLLSEQVEPTIYNNPTYGPAKIDIWMPTISNYEPVKSQDRQANHGEEVWWYYLYGDDPPLPNPVLMSHPGIEARITPWLAWAERVDGLLHYDTTDWSSNPWLTPNVTGRDNGDAFFFYPPRQDGADLDTCGENGHRLVPSIRWENLRDGMEDYEYLWLMAGGDPQVGLTNPADPFVAEIVASRTLYSQIPTDLAETRAAIAAVLGGPSAGKSVRPSVVSPGDGLTYTLVYTHSGVDATLVVTDSVPAATPVVTADGPGHIDLDGQQVTWQVPVSAGETVTLTIEATAGMAPGAVTNTAVFSSTHQLTRQAGLLIASDQLFLPLVMRRA
jgi:hypothetical protein